MSYDCGYRNPFSHAQVMSWDANLDKGLKGDLELADINSKLHKGTQSYVSKIENTHPGFIHEMY